MKDIYFLEEYGRMYEKCENGKAVLYTYDGKEGAINHLFILREIPTEVSDKRLYDIVTPYGYGGPIILRVAEGYTKEQLLAAFESDFSAYCDAHSIVSEFVRFHPVFGNAKDFASIYNSTPIRHTLGTDLTLDDPVTEEFSKGCRKNIRRAISKGVSWRITESPSDISAFKKIYYSTMDRNGAKDYYYFDDDYFSYCVDHFRKNLIFVEAIYEDTVIAAGLYFVYDGIIHIHLSGTLTEYLSLSPAYILRYAVALWGKENGYKLIHHGGGRSNAEDDSLYVFKKQFASKTSFEFFVGKKIWNATAYEELCKHYSVDPSAEFFPAYRMKM